MLKKIISYIFKTIKQSSFVHRYLESPINLKAFTTIGVFTDSFGNSFEIRKGLRSYIKPGWEAMFSPKPSIPSNKYIQTCSKNGKLLAHKLQSYATRFGKPIHKAHILEIGCNTGAASYHLAQLGALKVTGTEFNGYKVESIQNTQTTQQALEEVDANLHYMRSVLSQSFSQKDNVTFINDDICNSQLPHNSYDIICSFDVLEHLHNTAQAFKSMALLLKPGGLIIHDYNPFFALNGGHSLCTLDFEWGHARLNNTDFETYISMYRPNEYEQALAFYYKGLNRVTIHEMQSHIIDAGLTIEACIPYTRPQHIHTITHSILSQVQTHYPKATALDLISPRVVIIARK